MRRMDARLVAKSKAGAGRRDAFVGQPPASCTDRGGHIVVAVNALPADTEEKGRIIDVRLVGWRRPRLERAVLVVEVSTI